MYKHSHLTARLVGGHWTLFSNSETTGAILKLRANLTDTYAGIDLMGNDYLILRSGAAGKAIILADQTTEVARLYSSGADFLVQVQGTNGNLYLKPNGTGVVKFGTYTAGAATDSTGYITILDAAGNTRKLMVQA